VCKISSRKVQGFGFPLALHIPTDGQTNKNLYAHFYIYIDTSICVNQRHCVHRLSLPVYITVKPTTESVRLRWGQVLVNLYVNPKLVFMTLSPFIYLTFMI